MKRSNRFLITVIVVILLSATAISVWAAPGRVGTVPILPETVSGSFAETINFGTGTASIQASTTTGGVVTIQKVNDLITAIGPLPEGWIPLLNEALEVMVTDGSAASVEICVPNSPDLADRSPVFHYWNKDNQTWSAIPTELKSGDPEMVCGTGSSEGKYALLGK